MVWAGFGYSGKTEIVFLNDRQKSQDYIRVIEDHLLPSVGDLWPGFDFPTKQRVNSHFGYHSAMVSRQKRSGFELAGEKSRLKSH